jgi:NAD kinase
MISQINSPNFVNNPVIVPDFLEIRIRINKESYSDKVDIIFDGIKYVTIGKEQEIILSFSQTHLNCI